MINKILKELNKEEKEYSKQYKKELREVKKGKIKARVFYSKYKEPICALPCYIKRVYNFDFERGDIESNEITKEEFKQIESLNKRIIKLQEKKRELIKSLIKWK